MIRLLKFYMNYCCRYPANSNPTFSTFGQQQQQRAQGTSSRQCYATRHNEHHRRRQINSGDLKSEPNGYRSDGGYKSDGYKSDGEGYKSDRDGYKSDGGGYRLDGERFKQRRQRYNSGNQHISKKPSKYEMDRLAGRRLQPGAGACYMERSVSRSGSRAGDIVVASRSSSRAGYRSDPEHEIEIQLQCLGSQDDSGGSQHSHRGCSVEDEDEIIVVEEHNQHGHGGGLPMAQEQYRPSDSGESRAQSRNGYKSDGSHGSTQDSPLHLKPSCQNNNKHRMYAGGGLPVVPAPHLNYPGNHHPSYSVSHLNAQYLQHPQQHPHYPQHHRLGQHPNKHLEASRSFHTFQRQESTTSFHSTHSAPSQHHPLNSQNLLVNNIELASQASTHSHSSSSSASMGPPEYQSLIHQNPPPSYDQALIKLDIAMRRRAQSKRVQQQQKGAYNSLHYVGEFYG